jgi:cytochrome P450
MTFASTARQAPGPPGYPLIGNLLDFRRDVLGALLASRQAYGDIVRFRLGRTIVHLVAHPDHIQHVLLTQQHNYDKDTRSSAKIRSVTGDGLLTSNGAFWLRQRRLMQPIFSPLRVASFFGIMTEATAATLDRWTRIPTPTLDVASEMMRLTCTIVAKALFGADVTPDLDQIEQSATVLMEHAWHRLERFVDLPMFVPTPGNRRYHKALRQLDEIVQRIIARRRLFAQTDDLLTMLLRGKDDESGQSMSDVHVRNETITLLLSGHETTANSLTWTWYLLSQHPAIAQRARDEIAAVLGQRRPTLDDLPRLSYLTQVYRESLRLYPPIWIMERHARANDIIGGFRIPAGSSVVVSPFVTHRHPDFWDHPDQFDPGRFDPEPAARRAPLAYLPFGAGQRLCIGSHFAMMEALVILSMILQRFQLDLVPGHPVEPRPGITLRSRHGMRMTLRAR